MVWVGANRISEFDPVFDSFGFIYEPNSKACEECVTERRLNETGNLSHLISCNIGKDLVPHRRFGHSADYPAFIVKFQSSLDSIFHVVPQCVCSTLHESLVYMRSCVDKRHSKEDTLGKRIPNRRTLTHEIRKDY